MFDYAAYAVSLRRELHQYPEIGFDLTRTLALVRRELDAMGIAYTEKYGKSSIVATINPEKSHFTIGLRGDMDALPIQEKTGLPFASKNEGKMHACGHDIHTANLLAVARQLNDMRDEIRCCVKLLFTPAEEYITPGCMLMVQDGVADEVDCAVALHVNPTLPVGVVGLSAGGTNSNSMGLEAEFFGKSAHAHSQQKAVDAIRIAVEAYTALEMMLAREVPSTAPSLLNIGSFHGGTANNIIADYAKLQISSRTHSDELTAYMERRIKEICEGIAALHGGSAKVTVTKLLPYVYNDPVMTQRMQATARKLLGEENVKPAARGMGAEDFAFLSRKKPCVMVRLGVQDVNDPSTHNSVHSAVFNADERCFGVSIPLFVNFVLDNQDGIDF